MTKREYFFLFLVICLLGGMIGMWEYYQNLWDEINADVDQNFIQVWQVCPNSNHDCVLLSVNDWEHRSNEHRFINKINPTKQRYFCHWDWTLEKIKIAVDRKELVDN